MTTISPTIQWICQNRLSDNSTTDSVLQSMEQRFGDDFYERLLKRGVLKQLIQTTEPPAP
ncbi:MAG: hypothetical protein KC476_10220 [Cyanobacteria bacterium HKST-UBA06]|nr:hypothetical protein [Cyanobacteria bacterium HKST-UBA05]MCA9798588.1 hypothetical protein [Cyanobacteria bacterium HKST-UBA04]MCA9808318.1 hypothetical protein [Cyanobacteria bacterium HKST-UBA06]MCA9842153.1 hypothetical protein [Cyanobacteria bacterium HKST-UBA03]